MRLQRGAIVSPLAVDPLAHIAERLAALERAQQLLPPVISLMAPNGAGGLFATDLSIVCSSGSFVPCQSARVERVVRTGLRCYPGFATDVGTSGEAYLQITSPGGGTFATSTITIASGSNFRYLFRWLHGHRLWADLGVQVDIYARRTAGAGNFWIQVPYSGVEQIDPRRCTAAGV